MWDAIIYNYLKKRDIVIPPKERSDKDSKYAGAYVKEPIPGKYDWVVSFDLNSLYPHLIMQYNISPETLRDTDTQLDTVDKILNEELTFEMYKDNAVCANGAMYRKDVRGFLPELMEKIYKDRTIYKKKMLAAKQDYEKTPSKSLEKKSHDATIFKWQERFNSILPMVPLVISILGIINLQMLRQLLYRSGFHSLD